MKRSRYRIYHQNLGTSRADPLGTLVPPDRVHYYVYCLPAALRQHFSSTRVEILTEPAPRDLGGILVTLMTSDDMDDADEVLRECMRRYSATTPGLSFLVERRLA